MRLPPKTSTPACFQCCSGTSTRAVPCSRDRCCASRRQAEFPPQRWISQEICNIQEPNIGYLCHYDNRLQSEHRCGEVSERRFDKLATPRNPLMRMLWKINVDGPNSRIICGDFQQAGRGWLYEALFVLLAMAGMARNSTGPEVCGRRRIHPERRRTALLKRTVYAGHIGFERE